MKLIKLTLEEEYIRQCMLFIFHEYSYRWLNVVCYDLL